MCEIVIQLDNTWVCFNVHDSRIANKALFDTMKNLYILLRR